MGNSKYKIVILPLDGYSDGARALQALKEVLNDPQSEQLIAFAKINDAAHNHGSGGITIVRGIRDLAETYGCELGVFLDLKVFDVSATVKNILNKYVDNYPDILTVSAGCSVKTIIELRRLLPNTKLAMVSVPTDISEEECLARFGQTPAVKIFNDWNNINRIYQRDDSLIANECPEPFDLIVCSGHELPFLKNNLPDSYEYIVPGIRDAWMIKEEEHQKRKMGVREALDLGATYVVMGAQMMRGNKEKNISASESRHLTLQEIKKAYATDDPLSVLQECGGYYKSPEDENGRHYGPLVAYAGSYDAYSGAAQIHTPMIRNFVGFEYFNFAQAEQEPGILNFFAKLIGEKIKKSGIPCDIVIGAPMGGIMLAKAVGDYLGIRHIFAEKKVTALANSNQKEKSELVIDRHSLKEGYSAVVIEDVCNNFSTTQKLSDLINAHGAKLSGIACAFNRSGQDHWQTVPVLSSCFIPTKQYKQEDPEVAEFIKTGNIVWKPKLEWSLLMEHMFGAA